MMPKKDSIFSSIKNAYTITFQAIKKDHRIFLPFLIFAVVELTSLIFIYLIPRDPLRGVFGPIVSTLWGERFLHYPSNFLLLPKLAGLVRMSLSVLIGGVLTGVAVAYLYKKPASVALNKFANLFIVIFLLIGIYYFANKAIFVFLVKYFNAGHAKFLFIGPRWWLGAFAPVISQGLALLLQAIFIYAVPILITTEKKFIGAIASSFMFFIKNFFTTIILVALPLFLSVPLVILNYNGAFLMTTIAPEVILWLAILGVIVNSLMMDPLMTLTSASFYSSKRGK